MPKQRKRTPRENHLSNRPDRQGLLYKLALPDATKATSSRQSNIAEPPNRTSMGSEFRSLLPEFQPIHGGSSTTYGLPQVFEPPEQGSASGSSLSWPSGAPSNLLSPQSPFGSLDPVLGPYGTTPQFPPSESLVEDDGVFQSNMRAMGVTSGIPTVTVTDQNQPGTRLEPSQPIPPRWHIKDGDELRVQIQTSNGKRSFIARCCPRKRGSRADASLKNWGVKRYPTLESDRQFTSTTENPSTHFFRLNVEELEKVGRLKRTWEIPLAQLSDEYVKLELGSKILSSLGFIVDPQLTITTNGLLTVPNFQPPRSGSSSPYLSASSSISTPSMWAIDTYAGSYASSCAGSSDYLPLTPLSGSPASSGFPTDFAAISSRASSPFPMLDGTGETRSSFLTDPKY